MGLTSTPQSLFVVQTMLIRQLLFLGFYRLNAHVTGSFLWSTFVQKCSEAKCAKERSKKLSG